MTETALDLPDETKFKADIQAINKFQQVVHANLIKGQDWGIIPGISKPTLLKPGAEKISKLLGLCDHYEILDRQEDWGKPFFRYLIKCKLVSSSGMVITEGFGECNSMETKYRYRWIWPSELPDGFDKEHATKRTVNTRNGKVPQYRVDNDDIFSQVNTLIKMAKKRALVDGALSAGRLSNIFTQDLEDLADSELIGEWKPEVTPRVDKAEATAQLDENEQVPDIDKPKEKMPKEQAITRDPATVKTISNMLQACFKDFSLQPAQVLKELNVKSSSEITISPWECYLAIAAVYKDMTEAGI